MSDVKDGGTAFPIKGYCADASGALCGEVIIHPGMSRRFYAACAAMQGLIFRLDSADAAKLSELLSDRRGIARAALKLADALIEEEGKS